MHLPRLASLLLVLTACGSGETDLETSFCDLLANGPTDDVVATPDATGAPEAIAEDRAVRIALVDDGSGTYTGTVRFTTDEAGSFVIGLSEDIPVEVQAADTRVVPPANPVDGGCPELATRFTVDLDLAPYTLVFGPTSSSSVTIVSEESDDDS